MTATTARTITFSTKDPRTRVNTGVRAFPAGTEVHVTVRRGKLEARVRGTRFTQTVAPSALIVP